MIGHYSIHPMHIHLFPSSSNLRICSLQNERANGKFNPLSFFFTSFPHFSAAHKFSFQNSNIAKSHFKMFARNSSSNSSSFPSISIHRQMNSLRNMNLFLAFMLCPFFGTSAFLAPPSIADDAHKIHLLDGKILLKISSLDSIPSTDPLDEQVCPKLPHRNATILHSISKSTGQVVHLHPHSHFDVILCGKLVEKEKGIEWQQDGQQQCAIGANCAGLYRWRRAMVRHSHPRMHGGFVQDFVLVPVDCLCVFGWAENFGAQNEPVVLE